MNVKKVKDIFTQEELNILNSKLDYSIIPIDNNHNYINRKIDSEGRGIDDELGRLQFGPLKNLPIEIIDKVNKIAQNFLNEELVMNNVTAVEYASLYGSPNLPVHYDHDTTDLIVNFQLSSNTKWSIGVDFNVYELEDNSSLVFSGNQYTHWRPNKIFKDGEYIKMIFFRFKKKNISSDYSHLDYIIGHDVFKKIEKFRSSLKDEL